LKWHPRHIIVVVVVVLRRCVGVRKLNSWKLCKRGDHRLLLLGGNEILRLLSAKVQQFGKRDDDDEFRGERRTSTVASETILRSESPYFSPPKLASSLLNGHDGF
jgi:hypothetical protein